MNTVLFFFAAEGEEHANELLFAPVWFAVIAGVIALSLLALLWSFRNTLALDPHVEHDNDEDGTAAGQHGSDGGPGPIKGQASQH